VYAEASRLFRSRYAVALAVVSMLTALPVLLFAGEVFPAVVAMTLVFACYLLLVRMLRVAVGRYVVVAAALLAVVSAMLAWQHTRYLPAAVVLPGAGVCLLLWRLRTHDTGLSRKTLIAAIGALVSVTAANFGLIAWYCLHYFGTWYPQYRQGGSADFSTLDLLRPVLLYARMFFDRQSGLVPWVPVVLLVPFGLVVLLRRVPVTAMLLLACVAGLLGVFLSAAFAGYIDPGYAFPGRFHGGVHASICARSRCSDGLGTVPCIADSHIAAGTTCNAYCSGNRIAAAG